MRIEEQKTLLRYGRLMWRIAYAKHPDAPNPDGIDESTVHKTHAYKKLRAFFLRLRPARKAQFLTFITRQMDGIDKVMAYAQATGEPFSLADLELDLFDVATGQAVAAPVFGGDDSGDDETTQEQSNG